MCRMIRVHYGRWGRRRPKGEEERSARRRASVWKWEGVCETIKLYPLEEGRSEPRHQMVLSTLWCGCVILINLSNVYINDRPFHCLAEDKLPTRISIFSVRPPILLHFSPSSLGWPHQRRPRPIELGSCTCCFDPSLWFYQMYPGEVQSLGKRIKSN